MAAVNKTPTVIPVEVCVGTTCYLMGAADILAALDDLPPATKQHLDIRYIRCLEACGRGPRVKVGSCEMFKVTPKEVINVVRDNLQAEV